MSSESASASVDSERVKRLTRHGQEQLLRFWPELDAPARERLGSEIDALDLDLLDGLIETLVKGDPAVRLDPARVRPVPVDRLPLTDGERAARRRAAERGEECLAAGEVAVVVVAGGQGTRLGFDGPKGTFPIGPVSNASLFQIHAEKVVALGRRYGRPIPLFVMTSPDNHDATVRFFAERDNFGLDRVRFFTQGRMPAVDLQSGKILLADKGSIALSPDGHGGTIRALAKPGVRGEPSCLDEMKQLGIRTLFYFQVDNPLVQIADPAFLGLHRERDAEVSFKVVEKLTPAEKVGVVVAVDGVPQVIEYSDLPDELAEAREADGSLRHWAGSIAIHVFERDFLAKIAAEASLPFHKAVKKVKHVDSQGRPVEPTEPNAVKFESFIFDALPLAKRWTLVETDRSQEFEPLKNAIGSDSPASVRQRLSDIYADWLESAGATVLRREDGSVPFGVEISPLFAFDAGELKAKIAPGFVVEGPICLRES